MMGSTDRVAIPGFTTGIGIGAPEGVGGQVQDAWLSRTISEVAIGSQSRVGDGQSCEVDWTNTWVAPISRSRLLTT